MSLNIVQGKDASGGTVATLSISSLSAIVATDLVALFVGWKDPSATIASITGGGGITAAQQSGSTLSDAAGDHSHSAIFLLNSATSADTSVTVNFSATLATGCYAALLEISGHDTATQPDVAASSTFNLNKNSTADAVTGGAVTPTSNNTLILGFCYTAFTGSLTGWAVGTGETLAFTPGNNVVGIVEYKLQGFGGTPVSSTFTATGATGNVDGSCWTVAIRPAGSGVVYQGEGIQCSPSFASPC